MKKKCIFPGSFDPFTNGHLDILNQASNIFDEIIVAIGKNENKKFTFDLDTRLEMIKLATKDLVKIKVRNFCGLLADFAQKEEANFIMRGIRSNTDFEYELQISHTNSSLNPKVQTIFLTPNLQNSFISSTIVKAIYLNKSSNFSHLVPKEVYKIMQNYKKDEK